MDIPANAAAPGGFITDWVLLGPFVSTGASPDAVPRPGLDRDFLEPLGGEARAVLTPRTTVAYQAPDGGRRVARARRVGPAFDSEDRPDFAHVLDGRQVLEQDYDQAVGYAFCHLLSDRDQTVYAYLGSDGSTKVFLNGRLAHEARPQRKTRPWQDRMKLALRRGSNPILIKIDNALDWWGFQIEVRDAEHHLQAVRAALRGLSIRRIDADAARLTVTAALDPEPFDFQVPIEASAEDEQGRTLVRAAGETGRPVALRLPVGCAGPVVVRAVAAGDDLKPAASLHYVGDFGAAVGQWRSRFAGAAAETGWLGGPWRKACDGLCRWVDRFLRADCPAADDKAVRTLRYVAALTSALEGRVNFAAQHACEALPVWFSGGAEAPEGTYHVFLPPGYPDADAPYPLVIDLHGSNAGARKAPLDGGGAANVPLTDPPVIAVAPVTLRLGWDVDFLNAVLADVEARFAVDADRVYLQGGSMGGKGAWDWAAANPEHFAAVCVKCGTDGRPARAERMRHVPVWVFNGEKDLASYPFMPELMVTALRRAGGQVRYTLFPDLAHSMGDAIDQAVVKRWFLRHRRCGQAAPPDPFDALGIGPEGISRVDVVDADAADALALTEQEESPYPQDNIYRSRLQSRCNGIGDLSAVKLYQACRRTSGRRPDRLADGRVMLRTTGGGPDAPVQMLLCAAEGGLQSRYIAIGASIGAQRKGDLKAVRLPAIRAGRAYVRCTWRELARARDRIRGDLAARGLRLSGEERAIILPDGLRGEGRTWELLVAVAGA